MKIWTILLALLLLLTGCGSTEPLMASEVLHTTEAASVWTYGYGIRPIIAPSHINGEELYISGYVSGEVNHGYLTVNGSPDYCEAKAVYMNAGDAGLLLVGIDCVALSRSTVNEIRNRLFEAAAEVGCTAIHVYATHTHAGPDTLGLWGPIGLDGKNEDYMNALVQAAVEAGQVALADTHTGELRFGEAATDGILFDSRDPQVYDKSLYQLRFTGEDGGVRLLLYGAHAESLRGANRMLSRDFPGVMCDLVEEETGDPAMFLPGAIGGLLYTKELTTDGFDAEKNLHLTGEALAAYALSIQPENETVLSPSLSCATTEFTTPLENPLFLLYKFLGILGNDAEEGDSGTGYLVRSEMSLLRLGDLHIAMIPGEIFPELVWGGNYHTYGTGGENPTPLVEIAAGYGVEKLLILGMCDDELGYIVPPSDFLVHPDAPYLEKIKDTTGENHYEETNSTGPVTAHTIAETLEKLLGMLYEGE